MSKDKKIVMANGYYQTAKLRRLRRTNHIPIESQALFYELIAIWNECEWQDTFICSNGELCSNLSIGEKSLIIYRNYLVEAGLIFYQSGKSKKIRGSYSFVKEVNHCRNYSQNYSSSDSSSDSSSEPINVPTTVATPVATTVATTVKFTGVCTDYKKKHKTKTKTKTKTNVLLSGEKSPVKKVDKILDLKTTLYWKKIVDVWFVFYKTNFKIDPTFTSEAAKNLKNISARIEKLATTSENPMAWTEENAERLLNHFFKKAYQEPWLRENYLLSNLYSKFDSIVVKNSQNEKQPTGGAVSTESAFAKIDKMPISVAE